MPAVSESVLAQAFTAARTTNRFRPEPVADDTLHRLYELMKWGPTSMNAQPARWVFVKSEQAKARLAPCLSPGNLEKTLAAPVTVIVATDTQFYDFMPEQFPAYDARPGMIAKPDLAEATARRNGTLQGGYLIIAARLLGLDCGPMSGFDAARLDAEFFPDGRWRANFLCNLGYGDPSGNHPRGPRLPFETVARIV